MPSRSATARASWKSSSEQQLPAPSRARRSEMPTTSCPAATQRAAATALSTPPLIATTTLAPHRVGSLPDAPCGPRLRRGPPLGVGRSRGLHPHLPNELRQQIQDRVDLGGRRPRPEAQAEAAAGGLVVEAHGAQHV